MKLTMTDGRLHAYGPGQKLDAESNQVSPTVGRGFDGPALHDVVGVRGSLGYVFVRFADAAAADLARSMTGWGDGADATELMAHELAGCMQIFNETTHRTEYFGAWEVR